MGRDYQLVYELKNILARISSENAKIPKNQMPIVAVQEMMFIPGSLSRR
jgi:hypothetical protein